jgi:leucyl-tRNA synthetase
MTQEKQMAKVYDPSEVEEKWYKFWEENGFFTPKVEPGLKAFQYCYASAECDRLSSSWSCYG